MSNNNPFGFDDEFPDEVERPDDPVEDDGATESETTDETTPSAAEFAADLFDHMGVDPENLADETREKIERLTEWADQAAREHMASDKIWADLSEMASPMATDASDYAVAVLSGTFEMAKMVDPTEMPVNFTVLCKRNGELCAFGIPVPGKVVDRAAKPPRTRGIAIVSAIVTWTAFELLKEHRPDELVRITILSRGYLNVIKPDTVAYEPFRRDTEYGTPLRVIGLCINEAGGAGTTSMSAYIRTDTKEPEMVDLKKYGMSIQRNDEWGQTLAEVFENAFDNALGVMGIKDDD